MANVRATYRLQLQPAFGFGAAADVAGYLAKLGVSHAYCSPYLQANPGSMHGYDVADPTRLNADLGGEVEHARFCEALRSHGLGQLLDIVPNHMAVGNPRNRWFWDVLEDGPRSPYARYFDIDWWGDGKTAPSVLVPILGDHFGRVLERNELRLERVGAEVHIAYFEHRLPLCPASLVPMLAKVSSQLNSASLSAFLGEWTGVDAVPPGSDHAALWSRYERKQALRDRLQVLLQTNENLSSTFDRLLVETSEDPDALEGVLSEQHYRLARWRVANDELDYRRFFNIQTLIGLRMEDARVFDHVHRLPLQLIEQGLVDGLRVDHVDGLRDPTGYLMRLRERAGAQAYLVVEKILAPDERLRPDWPVQGTTGYEFILDVNNLLVAADNEAAMNRVYSEFSGDADDYPELEHAAKVHVMTHLLHAEVDSLVRLLEELCMRFRRHRDHTRRELREALREFIAAFDVYRTYVPPGGKAALAAEDMRRVETALADLRARKPDLDQELLGWLAQLASSPGSDRVEQELCLRLAQVGSAVMAKGAEDTAFYRYNRLLSLNEVGGAPARFGTSPDHFHARMQRRAEQEPHAMLTLSTHDTKRSGDVRARLHVLSELPEAFLELCVDLRALGAQHRQGTLPDGGTEFLLYQTLVGAYPIDEERLSAFLVKAMREAKRYSSWMTPDAQYESAIVAYGQAMLNDQACIKRIEQFLREHRIVALGRLNALVQTTLLLTCPGVPDIYQGTELWDLSLVDPDNRRPVDYEAREKLLARLDSGESPPTLAEDDDGLHKLKLVATLLRHRAACSACYLDAPYTPLQTRGSRSQQAVAFARRDLVVVVPRLSASRGPSWADTVVELPPGEFRNLLADGAAHSGTCAVEDLLAPFPVAVLARVSHA